MADAPSGGAKWDAFEIALVVILIAGILMQITKTKVATSTTSNNTTKSAVVTKPTATPHEVCGLTTTRPRSLEKVRVSVPISGSITGCNWTPTSEVALYAQVIDSYGEPVSAYTAIPPSEMTGASVLFNTTIRMSDQPTEGVGYLILIPATGGSVTARIPITFSE